MYIPTYLKINIKYAFMPCGIDTVIMVEAGEFTN